MSQMEKDKHHTISCICGTQKTKHQAHRHEQQIGARQRLVAAVGGMGEGVKRYKLTDVTGRNARHG